MWINEEKVCKLFNGLISPNHWIIMRKHYFSTLSILSVGFLTANLHVASIACLLGLWTIVFIILWLSTFLYVFVWAPNWLWKCFGLSNEWNEIDRFASLRVVLSILKTHTLCWNSWSASASCVRFKRFSMTFVTFLVAFQIIVVKLKTLSIWINV